jgi:hypothetical protein
MGTLGTGRFPLTRLVSEAAHDCILLTDSSALCGGTFYGYAQEQVGGDE